MAEPVPVAGLFETHLTVADLPRSVAFYRDVVGLSLAFEVPERGAALFWVAGPGEGLLGLWSMGSAPMGPCFTWPSRRRSRTSSAPASACAHSG